MRTNTYKKCLDNYGEWWDSTDDIKRSTLHQKFPHSSIVEGEWHQEKGMAEQWCLKNIGAKEVSWTNLSYGKSGYDYGFFEFFFKGKKDLHAFEEAVPTFYAETEAGKWRTDGYENFIDL